MAYNHKLVNYIFDFIQKNKDSDAIYMYATVVEPRKMYLQNRQYSSWRDLDNATQLSDILDTNYIYVFPGDTLEFSFPTFNLNNKTYISVLLRTYANIQPIINYENWVEGRNGIFRGYIELNSFDELLPTAGNYIKILPEWAKWEEYRSLPFYQAKQLYETGTITPNTSQNVDIVKTEYDTIVSNSGDTSIKDFGKNDNTNQNYNLIEDDITTAKYVFVHDKTTTFNEKFAKNQNQNTTIKNDFQKNQNTVVTETFSNDDNFKPKEEPTAEPPKSNKGILSLGLIISLWNLFK